MRVSSLAVAAASAFWATAAVAAPVPQGYDLLQTPATVAHNFGVGVVATSKGVLLGTVGTSLYSLAQSGSGAWVSSVLGQSWSTGTGATADGFAFAEGKVALDASGAIYAATALNLEGGGGVLKFTPPASGKTAWTRPCCGRSRPAAPAPRSMPGCWWTPRARSTAPRAAARRSPARPAAASAPCSS